MGCPSVGKIINSLKLVDYLHVQADNPWYNYMYRVGGQFFTQSSIVILRPVVEKIFFNHDICCGYSNKQSQ